jgi:uncharacterized membrane protein (UPF0127 family)
LWNENASAALLAAKGRKGGLSPLKLKLPEKRIKKKFYVYNETRQSFLSLGVSIADTFFTSLKGLLGKRTLPNDEGLWVIPSQGIHTVGLMFPVDLIYLDANQKVIHLVEHLRPFRFAPIKAGSESVLELPVRTICRSDTRIGDGFVICSADEVETYWRSDRTARARGG